MTGRAVGDRPFGHHRVYSARLPIRPDEAWALLSDPRQLDALTPSWFDIELLQAPPAAGPGTAFDYVMRWRGLRFRWRSRVTDWHPPHRLTYEQEIGPYRAFRHEHLFLPRVYGTEIVDRVAFAVPGGRALGAAVVAPELARIFAYRTAALERRFGAVHDATSPPRLSAPRCSTPAAAP